MLAVYLKELQRENVRNIFTKDVRHTANTSPLVSC